jgi:hypothetical protein
MSEGDARSVLGGACGCTPAGPDVLWCRHPGGARLILTSLEARVAGIYVEASTDPVPWDQARAQLSQAEQCITRALGAPAVEQRPACAGGECDTACVEWPVGPQRLALVAHGLVEDMTRTTATLSLRSSQWPGCAKR